MICDQCNYDDEIFYENDKRKIVLKFKNKIVGEICSLMKYSDYMNRDKFILQDGIIELEFQSLTELQYFMNYADSIGIQA